jgi:hypothetical protein
MNLLDAMVARTLKPALIVLGLATCIAVLAALSLNTFVNVITPGVDYTASSVPALRHWGFMVFGIGALMVTAAFRPQLRYETLMFATIEKAFMVYLFLSNMQAPWGAAYTSLAVGDSIMAVYGILFFMSAHGRPLRWKSASWGV